MHHSSCRNADLSASGILLSEEVLQSESKDKVLGLLVDCDMSVDVSEF